MKFGMKLCLILCMFLISSMFGVSEAKANHGNGVFAVQNVAPSVVLQSVYQPQQQVFVQQVHQPRVQQVVVQQVPQHVQRVQQVVVQQVHQPRVQQVVVQQVHQPRVQQVVVQRAHNNNIVVQQVQRQPATVTRSVTVSRPQRLRVFGR